MNILLWKATKLVYFNPAIDELLVPTTVEKQRVHLLRSEINLLTSTIFVPYLCAMSTALTGHSLSATRLAAWPTTSDRGSSAGWSLDVRTGAIKILSIEAHHQPSSRQYFAALYQVVEYFLPVVMETSYSTTSTGSSIYEKPLMLEVSFS